MIRVYKMLLTQLSGRGLTHIHPISIANNCVISRLLSNIQFPVIVHGHKMILDKNDNLQLSIRGIYEPKETELIKQIVKKGDTVIDIGANIGYYTLLLAKIVGNEGRVFAFEPDPNNFKILKKNVEINGYKNVKLEQKAISDTTKKIFLYVSKYKGVESRLYCMGDDKIKIEVETIKIDDYFINFDGKINFIKMDVEGAELAVIEGMSAVIHKNKEMKIILEYLPIGIERLGYKPKKLLDILIDNNFSLYDIDENNQTIVKVNPDTINIKYPSIHEYNRTNLYCVRESFNF